MTPKKTFLHKWERQKLSTCKFPLAFLDGIILAWKNPESLAWTTGKIKSKEGKQRNRRRKISNRGRNSTPEQERSKWDWKDKRHAQRNGGYPEESCDPTKIHIFNAVFSSVTKQGRRWWESSKHFSIQLKDHWHRKSIAVNTERLYKLLHQS